VAAAPRAAAGPAVPPRPQPTAETADRTSWDDLFPRLNPTQQDELLSLARRQGLLYLHQLPATTNGNGTDRARQFLASVLAGKTADLPTISTQPIPLIDTDLDATQRDAVARALQTPDVCLIAGLPGTGKSRVVAEIVTQAARRGERVLLLSPSTPAIDRVLEQVSDRDAIYAVRCLGRDERFDHLPPAIAGLTFADRLRQFGEQAVAAGRRHVESAEQRCRRRRQDEAVLVRLRELADECQHLDAQARVILEERGMLTAEVEREAEAPAPGPFADALANCARSRDDALRAIDAARTALEQRRAEQMRELEELTGEVAEVRPLAEAKEHGRFWSGQWWKATFSGNATTRLAELESRQQTVQKALADLTEESHALDRRRADAELAHKVERAKPIAEETQRRQAILDERGSVLNRDRDLLKEKWRLGLAELDADMPRPAELSLAAVERATLDWRDRLDREEQETAFAREWADGLAALQPTLPQRLASLVNLVAAPTNAIAADPHFADAAEFDLLVLEQAHLVTDSEFLAAARRARRWVLVGEPEIAEPRSNGAAETRRPGDDGRSRISRPRVASSPRVLPRLWDKLHCDPRQLPYAWFHEGDRLGCRLRTLAPEQRSYLECEPVVDCPDIELRILASPRTEPILAEVLFPASRSVLQAKEYIFRELQELPLRARNHSLCWSESPDRVVLRLADSESSGAVPIALEHGVRELVSGYDPASNGAGAAHWHTCCLEFDRCAGWDRARAEEWLERHLGIRDLRRTIRLDVPHRTRPELAAFLSDLLFANAYRLVNGPAREGNGHPAPVEFVAVPPLEPELRRRGDTTNGTRHAPSRARPSKGGAGFELDLSDPRHRDRLPAELRPELPALGLVNYLEAQAVIRALERLAPHERGTVGVLALYPAQAELIRCMLRRSPQLTSLDVRVDVPAATHEREFAVVLLSLTRSHSHRAVTFGEGPHHLTLALTRARQRLILFGDPGTLARRSQWEGPVDHLDESAAAHERELVAHLLRYLQGDGTHARAFHLHESTRA